jgi:hypothetical protein
MPPRTTNGSGANPREQAPACAVEPEENDEERARDDAGQEELVDRYAGDVRVDDERKTGREQEPQRARRRHEAEREPFRVARLHQRRQQQTTHRDDSHAARAGEGGEQGAGE